jgi:RNA polymerase sigma-70 factor (ECF subfamily)
VAAYQDRISRLVYRLLGWRDRGDVEDVVQDVFFAAFEHRSRFRAEAGLGTWLTAIAINRCRSWQRRMLIRRLLPVRRAADSASPPAWTGPVVSEMSSRVRQAVQALPPRDREVVVLHYFEGLSAAEIGDVTKQRTNAVEVRLHRARAKLSKALGALHREAGL